MTFEQFLLQCADNHELIANFDRLHGTNLLLKGKVIEVMVDKASGRLDSDVEKFVEFIYENIWLPVWAKENEVQS